MPLTLSLRKNWTSKRLCTLGRISLVKTICPYLAEVINRAETLTPVPIMPNSQRCFAPKTPT